jgi:zinc transport system substrate-binding protein
MWRESMNKYFVIFLMSFFILLACSKDEKDVEKTEKGKTTVVSVNYPLHYFGQRIGGNQVEALYPIAPDGDPAYWNPDQEGISVFQQADVILLNGAGYAKWIDKVSLPTSKMINTSEGLKESYIELQEGMTHSHGPEGDHVHRGYAFTTWLDLKFAIEQAAVVKSRLSQLLPQQKDYFEMNYQELKTDLGILDQELIKVSQDLQQTNLFGSHPVYQYLARGYDLTIRSEHWEPDQVPSQEQWAIFKDKLKHYPGKIMLWEGPPLPEVADKLTNVGIKVVVFNPCGNLPQSGDFISIMKQNIENLKAVL